MSSLSQFIGGGNKIKSIQRGTALLGSGSSSISISPVNPSKTIVYFNSLNFSGAGTGSGIVFSNGFSITLTGTSTITISGQVIQSPAYGAQGYLSFEVVEFF